MDPAITVANLLEYWRDCLADESVSGIPFEQTEKEATTLIHTLESGRLGTELTEKIWRSFTAKTNDAKETVEQLETIGVIIGLGRISSAYRNAARRSALAPMVPIWLPAYISKNGILTPHEKRHPFITRILLEPSSCQVAVGTLDDADSYYQSHVPQKGWNDDWQACFQWTLDLWLAVTGMDLLSYTSEEFHFEPTAYIIPSNAPSESTTLIDVFDFARNRTKKGAGPEILHSIVQAQAAVVHDHANGTKHFGHYGPHPLTKDQRLALDHISLLHQSQIQAINGPPGTGKTTLLRSVIASAVVSAIIPSGNALALEPLIIVATSTNNNAVLNVLSSLRDMDDQSPLGKRWINGLGGYGAFFAGKKAAERMERTNSIYPTLLAKNDGTIRSTFDGLDIDAATKHFLQNYTDATGKNVQTLEEAILDLHTCVLTLKAKISSVTHQWNEYHRVANPDEEFAREALKKRSEKTLNILRSQRDEAERSLRATQEQHTSERLKIEKALDALQPIWWEAIFNFLDSVRRLRYRRFEKIYGADAQPYTGDLLNIETELRSRRSALKGIEAQVSAAYSAAKDAFLSAKQQFDREREQFEQICRNWREVIGQLEADNHITVDPNDGETIAQTLDLTYRTDAFCTAMRFWEGRWLLQMRNEKDQLWARMSADKVQNRHRCIAKIYPFAALTLHSIPMRFTHFISGTKPGRAREDGHSAPLVEGIDLLIIDEAGQVAPHLGAMGLIFAKKAVVVGDVHQLEPIISIDEPLSLVNVQNRISTRKEAAEDLAHHGMLVYSNGSSLMHMAQSATAYTSTQTKVPGSFLRTHYRCVPEIIQYCDELVYNGLIAQRPKLENRLFPPMGYAHVRGTSAKLGSSRINASEAQLIADFVVKNKARILEHYAQELASARTPENEALGRIIAIVTPYTAQANEIRRQLQKRLPNDISITVGTAFAMQGAEAHMVIYSNVLSPEDPASFVNSKKNLMNVAVSRAKDSFLFFGDLSTITRQPKGSALQLLSEHFLRHAGNALLDVPVAYYGENAEVIHVMHHKPHRELFQEACVSAKQWLLIVSPFLGKTALDPSIVSSVAAAVRRGVIVEILSDEALAGQKSAFAEPLRSAGANFRFVNQIHAKTLAIDESLLYEGSYNWLSAVAQGEYSRTESGWVVRGLAASKAIAAVRMYFRL